MRLVDRNWYTSSEGSDRGLPACRKIETFTDVISPLRSIRMNSVNIPYPISTRYAGQKAWSQFRRSTSFNFVGLYETEIGSHQRLFHPSHLGLLRQVASVGGRVRANRKRERASDLRSPYGIVPELSCGFCPLGVSHLCQSDAAKFCGWHGLAGPSPSGRLALRLSDPRLPARKNVV